MKRRTILVLLVLTASGCSQRQPGFDERYDAASAKIGKMAEDIDARVSASEMPQDEATSADH
ncbi:hypothetical protein [Novosphingobium album (ex Hu et al. 2023)]|uniref:Lipoprotein n=1 Tax=Novosphingobium album (ex Hu et al. 2023) TaxID=2930093 RepID=A0ABT0AXD8_9SPHN|nr:hypothetical protein [Novosphingobium album (ex Hu et al. 2023)]MCJ2177432.1 hypothetical protein [Novosphingobium album (ex Hu et al. 2023)]